MTKPTPLPPGLGPAFSTRDAVFHGVTPGRLRARGLVAPYHGVRSRAEATGIWEQARQYLPRMRDGQFFSHVTAARLYGIPLPRAVERQRELDVSGVGSRPRTVGVIGRRATDTPTRILGGLPVTRADWLFRELATVLPVDDLVIAADGLVRRKRPPSSIAELQLVVTRSGRGVRSAREAVHHVRPGTDSPMESMVRLLVIRAGLPEPVIGHAVRWPDGGFIGTPDLAYVAERIAIEYEGEHHRNDPKVFADDIERRENMQEAGWYVIRVISDHVLARPEELVARLARALADRRLRMQR